jgi:YegS/Rv2252/BmrU family lipid kinase
MYALLMLRETMETQFHNALLIHNPNAGNGGNARRRLIEQARRILSAGGIEAELAETTAPGHATEIAQQAARDGRQLVITCGGDGTLNEVVNGLASLTNGHRVPLALLPGGTANILAKELSLPWDIPRAAKQLVSAELREIALGLATPLEQPEKKRFFLSVAGAGPDGMIVYSVDLGLKARVGILAYWWQGACEVLRYTFPRFRVRAGDRQVEGTLVVVGRTKNYGGPFKITDQADLFKDEFEVMALTTQSGLRYLSYLPTLWMGNLRKEEDVHFWKADTLLCEPLDGNPVYAQLDGEPFARLPVEFSIVPRALKLLVPRGTPVSNSGSPREA